MRIPRVSRWYWVAAALAAAAGTTAYFLPRGHPGGPLSPTFDGPSTDLRQTVVLPTQDTPLPDGRSAIWCGSFQLAWDQLNALAGPGPVRVTGAEDLCQRLNDSRFGAGDLSPGTYHAAAGRLRDGFGEQLRADMARLFPGQPAPGVEPAPEDAVAAFGYLRAAVPFRLPYFEDRLTFRDPAGAETRVRAFGIRRGDSGPTELRQQVRVLFADGDEDGREVTSFAVDLCRDSAPDQVVVAVVPRPRSLAEAVDAVERRASGGPPGAPGGLNVYDTVLVPAMAWRVEHRFQELEGPDRRFGGGRLGGWYIGRASQVVEFRLDEGGADLRSAADQRMYKSLPRHYVVDRPYLVYLKRRGAAAPYLCVWVDNPELLAR